MQRCHPTRRRGFTLIELLMTMTIIAVLAAVVLPKFTDGGRLRVSAASSVLTSDIQLAQVMTISHPNRPVVVYFDTTTKYWLAYADSPQTPIPRADTGRPYVVQLGKGRMAGAAGSTVMHIHFKNANNNKTLRFNPQGGLEDFNSQPELYIHVKNAKGTEQLRITLDISPTTGTITEVAGGG
ncbi:MAG: prepilin-type N-terminal cleavage/methylation domain-containing protein [Planctomycetes bacterium]|nr:prepilin-type N-terminal cleavage/methylation domain-containing protein [Planctomycetota bacterium]